MDRRKFIAVAGASVMMPRMSLGQAASARDLADDIAIMREALKLHPGLYRYNGPRSMEDMIAALTPKFAAAQDLSSRYLLLSEFLAKIRCGHSHCNPYNQSDAVVAALFDRPTRLPFRFAWIDGHMVVLGDESGTGQLLPGSTIETVNGVAPRHLLKRLLPHARADGHNDGKRVAQMEMHNTDTYETFDIYQGLLAPPTGQLHRLQVRYPDDRRKNIELPALNLAQRQSSRRTGDTHGTSEPLWTWEMRGDIALLTMPTWVMFNSKWDWESWLDDRLASLINAKGLVIDLRDNEGGNDCGNVILSRLAESDLRFPGYEQRVRYRRTPASLDPFLDTWDKSFRTLGTDAEDMGNGFYRLARVEPTDIITAKSPRIAVPVAALIGPTCSSATFSFARRAKESGLIRLFGETSGGNLRGINGNGYFFVRLPTSGIEFDVPLVGNFPVTPQPDAGVKPDVFIRPTAADIVVGQDRCLDSALLWAERTS